MKTREDLTGQKFNDVTFIKFIRKNKDRFSIWLCKCDCGIEFESNSMKIKNNERKRCSVKCINKPKLSQLEKRLRVIFRGMKDRCYNPQVKHYIHYGNRGIKICDDWLNDIESFISWAKNNGYKSKLTIERIDVDKDYCPENCKWIPRTEQNYNTRKTKYHTFNGKTQHQNAWAREFNCHYQKIKNAAKLIESWIYNSFKITCGG